MSDKRGSHSMGGPRTIVTPNGYTVTMSRTLTREERERWEAAEREGLIRMAVAQLRAEAQARTGPDGPQRDME